VRRRRRGKRRGRRRGQRRGGARAHGRLWGGRGRRWVRKTNRGRRNQRGRRRGRGGKERRRRRGRSGGARRGLRARTRAAGRRDGGKRRCLRGTGRWRRSRRGRAAATEAHEVLQLRDGLQQRRKLSGERCRHALAVARDLVLQQLNGLLRKTTEGCSGHSHWRGSSSRVERHETVFFGGPPPATAGTTGKPGRKEALRHGELKC